MPVSQYQDSMVATGLGISVCAGEIAFGRNVGGRSANVCDVGAPVSLGR